MGRVKPSQARERQLLTSGIPYFKNEMGKKYKIVFPSLPGENDSFMYNEVTHDIKINGYKKRRCVNVDYQLSDEARDAVVRTDEETGDLLTDPATGRVINDGSCPLCEMDYLYGRKVFADVEQWKEENPDATEKEISEQYSERFDRRPVEGVTKKNRDDKSKELVRSNILLGIVYNLDDKNKYVVDSEGNPTYSLNIFDLTPARFNKLMTAAESALEYMEDGMKEISSEDGLAWTEFEFNFPMAENKQLSGKEMTIGAIPPGRSAIETHDNLKTKIEEEELADPEKLEKVFDELPSLKVRPIPELEKELQGRLEQYRAEMSEEEQEEMEERISEEEKTISDEDANDLVGKEVSGADSFGTADAGEPTFLD